MNSRATKKRADAKTGQKPRSEAKPRNEPHRLEWAVGGVSALTVLAMIGFLLYFALTGNGTKPSFAFEVQSVEAVDDMFNVSFSVKNHGDATAASVTVRGSLTLGDGSTESSEVTFGYLPANAELTGGLLFDNDPRRYRLKLKALGYEDP